MVDLSFCIYRRDSGKNKIAGLSFAEFEKGHKINNDFFLFAHDKLK